MKYCKKCGMLLEDNMERCIGCGSDVTDKKSYSKFPEPVQQKLDSEKKESGKKYLALLAITLVFIVILLMVGIYISQTHMLALEEDGENGPGTGMFTQMLMNSKKNNSGKSGKKSEVKDENGAYYKYVTLKDEAGNDMFTAVYPEDLSDVEVSVDCSRNSCKYPAVLSFVATNEDNTTQLTFTSPQHYQYIAGSGFSPEEIQENVKGCVSYYNFRGVESYLNEIIKQAYPTAKKIEALDEKSEESSSERLDKIVELYDVDKTDGLAKMFGLPEGTSFSHADTYKSDRIYNYRVITKEDHAVTCRFYVPVFCVTYDFDYEDEETQMNGQLLDCYILTVSSFEAGSDDLYDWYEDAFSMFINNYSLSEGFMNGVDAYAEDINASIDEGRIPAIIGKDDFGSLVKESGKAGTFSTAVRDFLSDKKDATKSFEADDYTINTGDSIVQVYFDPDRELLFTTGDETEYPGDEFIEFK
ncbi:MAG: hypothetical protein K6A71_12545 [Lachnospiraceae bacterium]|nr:hypothetical protein [Lachnospiraceae bacterium]